MHGKRKKEQYNVHAKEIIYFMNAETKIAKIIRPKGYFAHNALKQEITIIYLSIIA